MSSSFAGEAPATARLSMTASMTSDAWDRSAPLTLQRALETALRQNVNIAVGQAQYEAAGGAAEQQRGAFDPSFTAQHLDTYATRTLRTSERIPLLLGGLDLRYQATDTAVTQSGVTHQFMNGVIASLTATRTHLRDNALSLTGVPSQTTGVVTFQLRVPFLRNSGDAVSAPLRAADAEVNAAYGELEFTATQMLLSTALAYWDYVARVERLAIAQVSEKRGMGLVDEMRKLIDADEIPKANLNLALASLNDRRSTRIAAEQAVLESRRVLGRVLGLSPADVMSITTLADGFPDLPKNPPMLVGRVRELVQRAVDNRADIVALRLREDAANIRYEAAVRNQRPQLDAVVSASRSGLAEGVSTASVASGFGNAYGPGYGAGVIFQMPLNNYAARGLTRQQVAVLEAQRARVRELVATIDNSIETAAWAVQRANDQLIESDAAVKTYAASLESERIKRRLGTSTLIDVLNVEDRYNSSLLSQVSAKQNYASSIAQFRFETGVLLERDGDSYRTRVSDLFSPDVK